MVLPKEKINYEAAQKRPYEYLMKFEEQEVVKRSVAKTNGKSVGSYTYTEKIHKRGAVGDNNGQGKVKNHK